MIDKWKSAVEEELVCIGILNDSHQDPAKALRDAIQWNVDTALDPAVSEEAKKLQECYIIMRQSGRGIFSHHPEIYGVFHGTRKQAMALVKNLNLKAKSYFYWVARTKQLYPKDTV